MNPEKRSLQQNLTLYSRYQFFSGFLPWLPVFLLFFLERVSLQQALTLGAIYYVAVVALELPSGYLSDRFGRCLVLRASALSAVVAYLVFIPATSWLALCLAQLALAAFMAMKSGSDSALLYDSLLQLDRVDEYAEFEARAHRYSSLALALACILGGLVAGLALWLAYLLALAGAVAALWICWHFVEPSATGAAGVESAPSDATLMAHWQRCRDYLRHPLLAWLLGFYVVAFVMQHVLYEFYQPYLRLLNPASMQRLDTTPLLSGVFYGLSMLGGAFGASISLWLYRHLGLAPLLALCVSVQTLILAALAAVLHPVMLVVLVVRNLPMAVAHAPLMDAIAPHIHSSERASYLSLQSFAGRLAQGLLLFIIAATIGGGAPDAPQDPASIGAGQSVAVGFDWVTLSAMLRWSLLPGLVGLVLLWMYRRSVAGADTDTTVRGSSS